MCRHCTSLESTVLKRLAFTRTYKRYKINLELSNKSIPKRERQTIIPEDGRNVEVFFLQDKLFLKPWQIHSINKFELCTVTPINQLLYTDITFL